MLGVSRPFGGIRCLKWVTINDLKDNIDVQP
jgi:hypothetical protein